MAKKSGPQPTAPSGFNHSTVMDMCVICCGDDLELLKNSV